MAAAAAASPSAAHHAGGHQQVVSEPLKKIVGEGRNYKYVKNCLELHLGGESIQSLQDFDKFENLEVLFLNDNKLVTIVGLEKNFRLRRLYLMHNSIVSVTGSLRIMNYLEHLDLSFNHLRNLKKILEGLEHLRFLKTLSLVGNPCCEEPGYRIMVIQAIPSLNVLDFKVVTDLERQVALAKQRSAAAGSSGDAGVGAGGGQGAPAAQQADRKPKPRTSCLERLQAEAQRIRARQERAAAARRQQQQQQHGGEQGRQRGEEARPAPHRRPANEYFAVYSGSYEDRKIVRKFC